MTKQETECMWQLFVDKYCQKTPRLMSFLKRSTVVERAEACEIRLPEMIKPQAAWFRQGKLDELKEAFKRFQSEGSGQSYNPIEISDELVIIHSDDII